MGRPTKLSKALPQIERFFKRTLKAKIFSMTDLRKILEEKKSKWDLPRSFNTENFISALETLELKKIIFPFYPIVINRYAWGSLDYSDLVKLAMSLNARAYLSHYTALYLHELTEQLPKTIYASYEQKPNPSPASGNLVQSNIDRAFRNKPRTSKNSINVEGYTIVLLNGKNTESLGVIEQNGIRLTSLERTLIDCAVRPFYAGGVFEVLKAFNAAKDRVSVNKMQAMLQKIGYVYPYKQAIGFYLEKAGYRAKQIKLLETEPFVYNFYLTYQMGDMEYSPRWRLYYPKGM